MLLGQTEGYLVDSTESHPFARVVQPNWQVVGRLVAFEVCIDFHHCILDLWEGCWNHLSSILDSKCLVVLPYGVKFVVVGAMSKLLNNISFGLPS